MPFAELERTFRIVISCYSFCYTASNCSPTPDPKEREEGSVGFERVRHLSIEFISWEYIYFDCTVIVSSRSVPSESSFTAIPACSY